MTESLIAIDIGKTGAAAVFMAGKLRMVFDLPTITVEPEKGSAAKPRTFVDAVELRVRLGAAGFDAVAVIEAIHARPSGRRQVGGAEVEHGNSIQSQASLIESSTIVETTLRLMGVPVVRVQPVVWKRWAGLLKTDKKASLQKAREMFPEAAATALSRVKDNNRGEALLLGAYYMSKLK